MLKKARIHSNIDIFENFRIWKSTWAEPIAKIKIVNTILPASARSQFKFRILACVARACLSLCVNKEMRGVGSGPIVVALCQKQFLQETRSQAELLIFWGDVNTTWSLIFLFIGIGAWILRETKWFTFFNFSSSSSKFWFVVAWRQRWGQRQRVEYPRPSHALSQNYWRDAYPWRLMANFVFFYV